MTARHNRDFAADVAAFVHANTLIAPRARVLVALSGGPDSCALLFALLEIAQTGRLPFPVGVAHFHHGLRGTDADADAAFCAALSARWGVPCAVGIGAVQKMPGESPNAAARRDRYAFLLDVAGQWNADVITTAHTADDQAETVLNRVLRGVSIDGLAGIPVSRQLTPTVRVVRPLLGSSRASIEAYCAARNVTPRRDPSNHNPRYARSRIRARLPELVRAFNPRLVPALNRLAAHAARDAALLHALTDEWETRARVSGGNGSGVYFSVSVLQNAPAALCRRVLVRALRQATGDNTTPNPETTTDRWVSALEALLRQPETPPLQLPGNVRARVEDDVLRLWREEPTSLSKAGFSTLPLFVPGVATGKQSGFLVSADWLPPDATPVRSRRSRVVDISGAWLATRNPAASGTIVGGAANEEAAPLQVRSVLPGDRIAPLGMNGKTRLVHDILANAGVPQEQRASVVLVTRVDTGAVLWVAGLVQAEETRVTPEAQNVIRLQLQEAEATREAS